MDWKNRSKEELRENAVAVAAVADAVADTEFWINEYFENTGENREEYEKALKEMKR